MNKHTCVPGTALGLHKDKSHNVLHSPQFSLPPSAQPLTGPRECGWDLKAYPPIQASKEANFLCVWL